MVLISRANLRVLVKSSYTSEPLPRYSAGEAELFSTIDVFQSEAN